MRIGIIGGTGDLGKGLALRWSKKHKIMVGSRDLLKATKLASEYRAEAEAYYGVEMKGTIEGATNPEVSSNSEILVVSVPYSHTVQTCGSVKESVREGTVVISPAACVGMKWNSEEAVSARRNLNSLAEAVAQTLPDALVAAAFHTVPASKLANFEAVMNYDIAVAASVEKAYYAVAQLVKEIPGFRPLYAGSLEYAHILESLTSLLLTIGRLNKIKSPSLKFV